MKINQAGCWAVKIILVIGAIVSGLIGKEELTVICVIAAIFAFLYLNPEP